MTYLAGCAAAKASTENFVPMAKASETKVTLDHFVMVRIHARQPIDNQGIKQYPANDVKKSCSQIVATFKLGHAFHAKH